MRSRRTTAHLYALDTFTAHVALQDGYRYKDTHMRRRRGPKVQYPSLSVIQPLHHSASIALAGHSQHCPIQISQ